MDTYIRIHKPDAIVLAHRSRGFIEKLFHTSLIRYLALTAKRPLLIISKPGITNGPAAALTGAAPESVR